MTEDEVCLAELESENRRLNIQLANLDRDNDRLRTEKKAEHLRIYATVLAFLVVMGLIFYWSMLGANGAKHQAELETQKSLACITAGGIWDKTTGTCAWSRDAVTFVPEGSVNS